MNRTLATTLLLLVNLAIAAQRSCTDLRSDIARTPDTVFQISTQFCFALCGEIDRNTEPIVFSYFSLHSWATQGKWYPMIWWGSREWRTDCWISCTDSSLVVEELIRLPVGPGLARQWVPIQRHELWRHERADGSGVDYNQLTRFSLQLSPPTAEDSARIEEGFARQRRHTPWTDDALLGQVFLLAAFNKDRSQRFKDLRKTHELGGVVLQRHEELVGLLREWERANEDE